LIHFHSHTFIQNVAPYWLHKLLRSSVTSVLYCPKYTIFYTAGDRSYSNTPYLQSKYF